MQESESKKYKYLREAKNGLAQAKENMTMKYAGPILKGFGQYYEAITSVSPAAFHMDANTNITLEEYGKQREIPSLSSGYQDLIGLCLRVAFVDAMYQHERPVLILDDPFANLDDQKAEAGLKLLKKIADKYQIIYLTCSSSIK